MGQRRRRACHASRLSPSGRANGPAVGVHAIVGDGHLHHRLAGRAAAAQSLVPQTVGWAVGSVGPFVRMRGLRRTAGPDGAEQQPDGNAGGVGREVPDVAAAPGQERPLREFADRGLEH